MKKTILILIGATGIAALLSAQEVIPRRDAVRIAAYLNFDLSLFNNAPIPTDADVKRPVGLREGEYAGLIVPECKLSAESFANISADKIIPVGQLWLHNITLLKEDEPILTEKMQTFPLNYRDTQTEVNLCLLGARKKADGKLELLIFGKDKTPILSVPMKDSESQQEFPIEITAQREDSSAVVNLKIVGKYQANFKVTYSQ